jgi:tetratricopeptide (TPR) repeat protein
MNPNVRQILELLDGQFAQDGGLSYASLETAFEQARRAGNLDREAEMALQMGVRLSAVSTFASTLARRGQELPGMPTAADALEPAIPLLERAVELYATTQNGDREAFARNRLADSYLQSEQFEKALAEFAKVLEHCHMPEHSALIFDTVQKIGDCHLQLEQDAAALSAYQRGLEIAKEIDDPFEIHVQLGKIASALGNLKRYDESLAHYTESRELLLRLADDPALRQRISLKKNQFNVDALPRLIEYTDERISDIWEALGRDLLRELPYRLASIFSAALTAQPVPDLSTWPVYRELNQAVRRAVAVLSRMLNIQFDEHATDESEAGTLKLVGAFARYVVDPNIPDPNSIANAARYVVQVDRARRAAIHVGRAVASGAQPGPFGGATSAHCLYLRSFAASPHLPRMAVEPWGLLDLEELLACRFDESALIALGNPELERFGPGRWPTTDESWREVLRALGMEAQVIIVIPTYTQGTSWEIEWVTANKFLHKTCFLMPPPGPGDDAWWADNWRELRNWAVRLGLDLPAYTPEGSIFRLTSEGLLDQIDFSVIYGDGDLKMPLLNQLLFRSNISWDFAYGIQQSIEANRSDGTIEALPVAADYSKEALEALSPEERQILATLEASDRLEMSNWFYDAPQIPGEPGVLMYFETPFRMMWAEAVDNLNETLSHHSDGAVSVFTRSLFQLKVLNHLTRAQVDQLTTKALTIESIMSFKVKQMVSYRFVVVKDSDSRMRIADAVVRGASRHGVPEFARVLDK